MSYQLLQIRQERGHCYHPLHTFVSTLLWDLDVAGCSGRINNKAGKKNSWHWHAFWISWGVMFREDTVNIVDVLLCCTLSAVPWCFSLAPLVSFKDHLCLHLLPLCCVYVCDCVRPHSWSLTLHTWLLCTTSFSLAHLGVYSFIYGKPGNHRPCLGLLWQRGKAVQIYAWQQKLIRHQLTHANVYALNFF